ncbi:MAG: purine-nucleoside phosphorylase [Planctomycetota bacterium]
MTTPTTKDRAARVAEALAKRGVREPRVHAVLGSGLGDAAAFLERPVRIPFAEIDGLPTSAVPGHRGEFVHGEHGGTSVLLQCGRVHLYEGHDPRTVALTVRAAAALGARVLLLTNAAGCLRTEWPVGGWMRITDQLDLQGGSALLRDERGSGSPFSARLGEAVDAFARERELGWVAGVYAGLLGPRYESPSEVLALRSFGADAVGMSTVKEAAVGHALGLEVCGLSCLTNLAAGLADGALSHDEVVATGAPAAAALAAVLPELIDVLVEGVR